MDMRHLESNDDLVGLYKLVRDVTYSSARGRDLTMDLVVPWSAGEADSPRLPLVVFVQGSGWTTPDRDLELPQLCELARKGYVVATVGHRDCLNDDAPAPAQLVDVKCAIRFLRANADRYGIDANRVAVWGTSSGSHVAQLVGVTGDDLRYKTDEWDDRSDAVQAVVGCFGPSDWNRWLEVMWPTEAFAPLRDKLIGGSKGERTTLACELSAINHVAGQAGALPAFLLGVGTADPMVETSQVTRMADALEGVGADVEAFLVDGAQHETNFWSQGVFDLVAAFLARVLA